MEFLEGFYDLIEQPLTLNVFLSVEQAHAELVENLAHLDGILEDLLRVLSLAPLLVVDH